MTGSQASSSSAFSGLSTFCHISEYGEQGYESLLRMMAVSRPLNVWAPVGVELSKPTSALTAEQFVRFVEEGHIRVIAREPWLTDRGFRDGHIWEGARWTPALDDALLGIYRNDQSEPDPARRRVVAAPPEDGSAWAAERLEENPAEIDRWYRIARSPDAASRLFVGTYQAAGLAGDDPYRVALAILRNARNHGMAVHQSGAEYPVLLRKAEADFIDLVAGARPDGGGPHAEQAARRLDRDARVTEHLADVTVQLVELLGRLDPARSPAEFIGSEGHRLLVAWMAEVADWIKRYDPNDIDRLISEELYADLTKGFAVFRMSELGRRPWETLDFTAGAFDLSTALLGIADKSDIIGIAGVVASAFTALSGGLKAMGWVPAHFDGPQWPFLYVYGKRATKRRRDALLRQLGMAQP